MRQQLSLENLPNFDHGKVETAWQHSLRRAVLDLLDRPGETKARVVTLTANLRPILEQDGDVIDADVDFIIATKLPPMHTAAKPMATDRQGRLIFNDLADDNPHQSTIDELDDAE